MNAPVTALAERKPPTPMDAFRKEAVAMEREFSRALPPHIPVERFLRVVTTAVQTSSASKFTDLLECNRRSLWQACMRAAQDGLLPDGREGAVIKYGDDAQWVPMVAGIRKKARNSGEISTWDVHCVYKNDKFVLKLGDEPSIEHTYDLAQPRGELIGAYSVALLKDGSKSYEVMSIDEIRAIRDRSQAWKAYVAKKIKTTPWSTDEAEMARKTVAKRHAKQLPSSADLDDLIRSDDHLYETGPDDPGPAADTSAVAPKRVRGKAALDQFAGGLGENAKPQTQVIEHDPQTGEIAEETKDESNGAPSLPTTGGAQQEPGDGSVDSPSPGSAPYQDEAATTSPSAEKLEAARAMGEQHGKEGRALRAMPAEYREPGREEEAAAYREGHAGAVS